MPKVTQKGQVTIPQHIRSVLKIETGDEVIFELDEGKAVLKKRGTLVQNFKKYVGFLSHLRGKKTESIIDELRGNNDDCGH